MSRRVSHDRESIDCEVGISIYRHRLEWIQKAICSVVNQKSSYHIICTVRVDGPEGCDEETYNWLKLKCQKHKNLKVSFGKIRLGTYGSYSEIFRHGESIYICQLDSDDWIEDTAIEECITLLDKESSAPFIYTAYNEVDEKGTFLRQGKRSEKNFNSIRQLVQFNTFHLRVIRRYNYMIAGGYDKQLLYTGDYDLSLKLSEQGVPIYQPISCYNYRIHSENTSKKKRLETTDEAFKIAEKAIARRNLNHIFELEKTNNKKGEIAINIKLSNGPIVIAGMHRSGTSVLALILQMIGVKIGDNLTPKDHQNPDGYGEDREIVDINRRFLNRQIVNKEEGWKDWGWTINKNSSNKQIVDSSWIQDAREYINSRSLSDHFWGWKDPRNTLLLDNFLEIKPASKIIGIYRYPWEIVEALQRVKPPIFIQNPGWCLKIWSYYNEILINFAEKYPDKCIIINSNQLVKNPLAILEKLQKRWGWPTNQLSEMQKTKIKSLIRPDKHQSATLSDPLVKLQMVCSPKEMAILKRLDSIADIPSEFYRQNKPNYQLLEARTCRTPKISVVITSYNQGDLLLGAISSIEKYANKKTTEILIVDDGSTDQRTCQILVILSKHGYKIIRQKNRGLPTARNIGIANAQGKYLLFLDDDNRVLAPYFSEGSKIMDENSCVDVVYGDRINFGLHQKTIKIGNLNTNTLWESNKVDNCALIRRDYLMRSGGYCPELAGLGFEDWDLWLSGLKHTKGLNMAYLDKPCFEYRVRPNSMLQELLKDSTKYQRAIQILKSRHGNRVGKRRQANTTNS